MDVASANIRDLARWSMSTGRGRWVGAHIKGLQSADHDDLMQEVMFTVWRYRERALTKECPILYLATKTSYVAGRWWKQHKRVMKPLVDRHPAPQPPDYSGIWDWVPDEIKDFYYGTCPSGSEEAKAKGCSREAINGPRRRKRAKVFECLRQDPVFCDTYS